MAEPDHEESTVYRHTRLAAAALTAVLTLVACGGDDAPADDPTATSTEGDGGAAAADEVSLTGTDALKWEPAEATATAGEVTFTVEAGSAVNHTLVIEELDDQEVLAVAAGGTASGTATLEAGTYTYYCSVPGHREGGMVGTLTVS